MKKETEKNGVKMLAQRRVLYAADERPPVATLFFSSLQQMLLALSVGLALPVAVARTAGLPVELSGSYLAAALFCMGLVTILQSLPGRFAGSGLQSFSSCDSAAIAASVMAAELGGIPLVLGMTMFSGLLRFVLGSFAFRLRRFFPAEVTGTMVFILGINLVPTSFRYFFGSGSFSATHLIVAVLTFLFILSCALFIKPLKPYSALAGIVFGYVLSVAFGIFDSSSLQTAGSFVALPVYRELAFRFDARMIVPFAVITLAAVVDNIGDFSASQDANSNEKKKTDWKSIERGIRGSGLGSALSGLLGGSLQSTATTNIAIAKASGIASRSVAYVGAAMLMLVSFFPPVTNTLSMIPEPVLGAVLMYCMCYIMAGGFSTLRERELDDRRIFTIFLSIGFAVSTLIPGVWDFLPEAASGVLDTPMVMGVCVLVAVSLLGRIGRKKVCAFCCGVKPADVDRLREETEKVCRSWGTGEDTCKRLQIGLSALCEAVCEQLPDAKLAVTAVHDGGRLKLRAETDASGLDQTDGTFTVTELIMKRVFDESSISAETEKTVFTASLDLD